MDDKSSIIERYICTIFFLTLALQLRTHINHQRSRKRRSHGIQIRNVYNRLQLLRNDRSVIDADNYQIISKKQQSAAKLDQLTFMLFKAQSETYEFFEMNGLFVRMLEEELDATRTTVKRKTRENKKENGGASDPLFEDLKSEPTDFFIPLSDNHNDTSLPSLECNETDSFLDYWERTVGRRVLVPVNRANNDSPISLAELFGESGAENCGDPSHDEGAATLPVLFQDRYEGGQDSSLKIRKERRATL